MRDLTAPNCEATISAELIALIYGPTVAPAKATPVQSDCLASQAEIELPSHGEVFESTQAEANSTETDVRTPSNWPQVALRVDGQRPIRLDALLLCRCVSREPVHVTDAQSQFERTLCLYVTEQREIVAHLECRLEGAFSSRSRYRYAFLDLPDDLEKLLRSNGPRACMDALGGPILFDLSANKAERMPELGIAQA